MYKFESSQKKRRKEGIEDANIVQEEVSLSTK